MAQIASTEGANALRKSISGGCPNSTSAADHHVRDGPSGLLVRCGREDFEPMWQQPLVDQANDIPLRVECYSSEVLCAPAHGDFHEAKLGSDRQNTNRNGRMRLTTGFGPSSS